MFSDPAQHIFLSLWRLVSWDSEYFHHFLRQIITRPPTSPETLRAAGGWSADPGHTSVSEWSWPWHLGQTSLSLQINHFENIKNCIVHNELLTFTFEKRQLRQNWNSLFHQPELERDNRIISSESTILSFYFWHTSTSSSNFSDVNQCKVASYTNIIIWVNSPQ